MASPKSRPEGGEDLPGDYEIDPQSELDALHQLRDTQTQEEFRALWPDLAARLEQLERQLA